MRHRKGDRMFEKLKKWLLKETLTPETLPPVVVTIHGYGRRRKHEYDNFVLWGQKDGFEIIQFDMYDLFDETDCDWMHWVAKAKEVLDSYKQSGRDIYLVGFSMGGVIASYLANVTPVKKLILLAPAFQYMNMDMITDVIVKSATSFMSNEKKEEIPIPRAFYGAFTDLIKNLKKYISSVECPVLLLHGDQDEVISPKSSLYAYDKIPHARKKLVYLHGGHHRLFMDETVNWECYQIMKLFMEDKILGEDEIPQAIDIMEELLLKYKSLHQSDTNHEETKKEIV
ncbi:alpha/beta hydrolase [Amedibacillus sp. YH-ame6]